MELPVSRSPVSACLPGDCLYVYAIVERCPEPIALPDIGLQVTRAGNVAAVHCWIDPDELDDLAADIAEGSRLAALVRRHDDVVKALAAAGPVLPVRLGTLLPDRKSLSGLLRDREQEIRAALARVRDTGEWDLRVRAPELIDEARLLAAVGAPTAQSDPPGAGTRYLLRQRETRHRAMQFRETVQSAITRLDEGLTNLAASATRSGAATGDVIASRAYLVHESALNAFLATARDGVAELEDLGCAAVLRGPHPPYSFVDIRLEAFRNV